MKIKEYLTKKGISIRDFAKKNEISRDSIHQYINGKKPAARQAWLIFQATNGEVTFKDMRYSKPPKRPIKDI